MAAGVSANERIAHVVRRLSMGVHPDVLGGLHSTGAAIDRALSLAAPAATPPPFPAPADYTAASDPSAIAQPIAWWFGRMASPDRMIEERLVWFWHDHFATSLAKVQVPYLMWKQHLTLRAGATGNFATLLKNMATDPAMLVYLDGIRNEAKAPNENFGRECLELFTMGRDGGYTQDDVVAASRAFTGWVVDLVGRGGAGLNSPWNAVFVARRHDTGTKTLLGKTGAFDTTSAIDVILGHPSTAKFVAGKLYRELVGLPPSASTLDRLAAAFQRDYEIMPLVESIVRSDAFVADDAVRAKYRTPVEKVVAIVQAVGTGGINLGAVRPGATRQAPGGALSTALRTASFLPFLPPNVGGYPKGARLIGPGNLVHAFDLLGAVAAPTTDLSADETFARLGIFDVSDQSRTVLTSARQPATRFALAVGAPEFVVV